MTARSWVIEVCATCDRLAVWPFCEHKAKFFASEIFEGPPTWTRTVVVVPEERPTDE